MGLYLYRYDYPKIRIKKKTHKLHRVIYEAYYRCRLLPWTILHHKNQNKFDPTIDNLVPMIGIRKHVSIHHKKPEISLRRCAQCFRSWSRANRKGTPNWFKRGVNYICYRCYFREWREKNREWCRQQGRIHMRNHRNRIRKEKEKLFF